MDLVNSVTQNSNNHNVTMENQGGSDRSWAQGGYFGLRTNDQYATAAEGGQLMMMSSNENEALDTPSVNSFDSVAREKEPSSDAKYQVPDYLKAIGMDPRKFWPKKYRFTREKQPGEHNPLTIAQRNFYESNGYIVFDDCANKRLLDTIRAQYKESGELDNEFLLDKLLMKNNKLLQYVKCFCDERLMLMTHRLIDNFHSDPMSVRNLIDNRHQQRQLLFRDWIYLPFRPIDKVCCAITAIEPLDHVLLVVPGTHRVGQCTISSTLDNVAAAYESSQEKNSQSREIFECSPQRLSELVDKSKKGFKYINLKPGQTLFYHPGLIHGFSEDLVNFRKSQLVSVAYYAAADCEYIDLRKSAPSLLRNQEENNEQTLVPISLAHFGPDRNPIDYTSWLDKPRLVGSNKL